MEEHIRVKKVVTELIVSKITENPDLKKLLPEVDDDAKNQLRALIEAEGIREPLSLAVINSENILLDGHNRLRVARELGYVSVPVVFYDEIKDIVDAEIWMIHNQLARRNMSDMERIQVILRLEPELKAQAKKRQGGVVENSAQVGRVIDIIAKMADVSRATIGQAKKIIATEDAELIALADNQISINKAFKIAKLPAEKRKTKIDIIVKKIADKEAKETTEQQETITINGMELIKYSELSYVHKTDDDGTYKVYGLLNEDNKNKIISVVNVKDNRALVERVPPYFGGYKNYVIFKPENDDKSFDYIINQINTLLDNIKTAKKLADPARKIARQAYLDAHPEAKPPKAPSAKEKKAEANKLEIEALLKTDNRLTEAQKAEFKTSPLEHKVLVQTIKKAMNKADKQFGIRIDDARILGDMMIKHNLYEEQKEAVISTKYYTEEKTFKLRMKDRLSKLSDIVKAVKESTQKAIKETTPAKPKAITTKKKPATKTAKISAKAKAPAKAKAKTSKPSSNPNALSADDRKDIAEYFNNNEEVQSVLNTIKKNDSFNPDTIKIGGVSFAEVLQIMKERKETAMQKMIDNPTVVQLDRKHSNQAKGKAKAPETQATEAPEPQAVATSKMKPAKAPAKAKTPAKAKVTPKKAEKK